MPKFPPNTGFKMPGIGSKEINSPSNFRDEHHVDKMGYCEDTPDEMLPLGSSPLKYTPIIDDDPYTSVRGYDMSGLGEAIAESTKRKKKTQPKKELEKIQNEDQDPVVEKDKIEIDLGTGDYSGGGVIETKEQKDWYDNQIAQRVAKGMSRQEALQDYRNTYKIGEQDKDVAIIEGEKGKFKRTK